VDVSAITAEYIAANHPGIADHFRTEGAAAVAPEPLTFESIIAEHGELADALITQGATTERERIKSVQAQALPGYDDLVAEMMYDGTTSGPEAAVRILQADKAARAGQAQAIRDDAAVLNGAAPAAPAPAPQTQSDLSQLPLEDRCKAEYEKDATLRADFPTPEAYIASERARTNGKLRIIGPKQ